MVCRQRAAYPVKDAFLLDFGPETGAQADAANIEATPVGARPLGSTAHAFRAAVVESDDDFEAEDLPGLVPSGQAPGCGATGVDDFDAVVSPSKARFAHPSGSGVAIHTGPGIESGAVAVELAAAAAGRARDSGDCVVTLTVHVTAAASSDRLAVGGSGEALALPLMQVPASGAPAGVPAGGARAEGAPPLAGAGDGRRATSGLVFRVGQPHVDDEAVVPDMAGESASAAARASAGAVLAVRQAGSGTDGLVMKAIASRGGAASVGALRLRDTGLPDISPDGPGTVAAAAGEPEGELEGEQPTLLAARLTPACAHGSPSLLPEGNAAMIVDPRAATEPLAQTFGRPKSDSAAFITASAPAQPSGGSSGRASEATSGNAEAVNPAAAQPSDPIRRFSAAPQSADAVQCESGLTDSQSRHGGPTPRRAAPAVQAGAATLPEGASSARARAQASARVRRRHIPDSGSD